jgi:hypothetical protein
MSARSSAARLAVVFLLFALLAGERQAAAQAPLLAPAARAQAPGAATSTQPADQASDQTVIGPVWSFEINAGGTWTRTGQGGTARVPATGSLVAGRMSASTFYFGDGALTFNDNQRALFGTQGLTVVPLDAVLGAAAIERRQGPSLGVRLGRTVTDRLAIDITGDFNRTVLAFTPAALSAIDASRSSYASALTQAFVVAPSLAPVSSIATITDRQTTTQVSWAAALVLKLRPEGRFVPYVAAGGGAIYNNDTLPTVKLQGHYEIGDPAQLLGTDTVTLKFSEPVWSPMFSGGGGGEFAFASKWGVRADLRVRVFKNSWTNLVSVAPETAFRSIGQAFPVINRGVLQLAPTSPLNGASFSELTSYTGSGRQAQIAISVGLVRRF